MVNVYSRERSDHTISQPVLIGEIESSTTYAPHARGNPNPGIHSLVLMNWKPKPKVNLAEGIHRVRQQASALDHYFLMAVVRSFGGQISVSYPEMDEAIYGQMALVHEKTDAGLYIARVTGDPRNEG